MDQNVCGKDPKQGAVRVREWYGLENFLSIMVSAHLRRSNPLCLPVLQNCLGLIISSMCIDYKLMAQNSVILELLIVVDILE